MAGASPLDRRFAAMTAPGWPEPSAFPPQRSGERSATSRRSGLGVEPSAARRSRSGLPSVSQRSPAVGGSKTTRWKAILDKGGPVAAWAFVAVVAIAVSLVEWGTLSWGHWVSFPVVTLGGSFIGYSVSSSRGATVNWRPGAASGLVTAVALAVALYLAARTDLARILGPRYRVDAWTGWSPGFRLVQELLAHNALLYPSLIASVAFAWDVGSGRQGARRSARSWSGADHGGSPHSALD